MVLVDTSVWIDFFNGVESDGANELDGLLGSGRILMGNLIIAEILQGFTRNEQALGLHICRQTR